MGSGDLELTDDELRAVVRFAAACAERVLPVFEAVAPHDSRPRAAVDAARVFASGGARSQLQRTTAFAAHRAAKEVETETAQLAALACGDAAGAAYLHPIARATQVGHILGSAACAARVAELTSGVDASALDDLVALATDPVPDVLRRYPPAPAGRSRLAQLMQALDTAIRAR